MSFYAVAQAYNAASGFHEDPITAVGEAHFKSVLCYHTNSRPELVAECFAMPAILSQDALEHIKEVLGGEAAYAALMAGEPIPETAIDETPVAGLTEEGVVIDETPVVDGASFQDSTPVVDETPVDTSVDTPAADPVFDTPPVDVPVDTPVDAPVDTPPAE